MHQTVRVDIQSVYLGTVNRSDLIKSVGLLVMSNKRDPRAPGKLSAEELESHRDHPARKRLRFGKVGVMD